MAFEVFGWQFRRFKELENEKPSIAPKENDDGAVVVAEGGSFGTYVDLDGTVRTEAELVTRYRDMALQPECDAAVDEIVNESIAFDEPEIVKIMLDDVKVPETIKKVIREEFTNCLNILEFNRYAYEIYRRWYVDGRLYYHTMIDEKDPTKGITEVRYIDPRKIRKVREITKKRAPGNTPAEAALTKTQNEYYIFNERGFNVSNKTTATMTAAAGLKIAKDSILHVTSGLTDTNGTMVLSYLHKAIKPLNQLRTLEDAVVIYRLARAPERRVWYIDTGNLPKMKAEQYVRDIMNKHKNRLIYDADSGNVRDDRKFMCYALDTKIPLLDGRTLTIKEIIDEYEDGKLNWVYSCDPITGKFMPGPVSWAGITRRNTQVVRVTFDNGKSVVCTPDHKFPTWNRGFVEAKDLASGESLIPGYRRTSAVTPGGSEYEQIYQNDTGKWEFTHRLVSSWKDDHGLREDFTFVHDEPKTVVHHRDYDRRNNSPDNLIMMGWHDHLEYHRRSTKLFNDDIIESMTLAAMTQMSMKDAIEYVNNTIDHDEWNALNSHRQTKSRNISLVFNYADMNKICKANGYSGWRQFREQFSVVDRERNGRHRRASTVKGSSEWKRALSTARAGKVNFSKTWKIVYPNSETHVIENLNEFCRNMGLNRNNIKSKFGSKGYHAEVLRNHKVISVEWLDDLTDTAALTIDQEETYHSHHTYLLDAGVYTKNTMLEDYWLPRREGGRGTEVTTLPAGQNLGQMEDVLYFQKKLYQTLNVPINRLNSDQMFSLGRATEVTRDEVKFAKFITRLRAKFSMIFIKMLEKQLVLKQIMSIEDWINIQSDIKFDFAKDNFFTELKNAEVMENRFKMAEASIAVAGKYVSHEWVRKNIMMQSEDEIEEQDKLIAEEIATGDPRWINPMITQNQEAEQQSVMNMAGLGMDGQEPQAGGSEQNDAMPDGSGDARPDGPSNKLKKAMAQYERLKDVKNRSPGEESEFRSAAMILGLSK